VLERGQLILDLHECVHDGLRQARIARPAGIPPSACLQLAAVEDRREHAGAQAPERERTAAKHRRAHAAEACRQLQRRQHLRPGGRELRVARGDLRLGRPDVGPAPKQQGRNTERGQRRRRERRQAGAASDLARVIGLAADQRRALRSAASSSCGIAPAVELYSACAELEGRCVPVFCRERATPARRACLECPAGEQPRSSSASS
jgi:hypothetical protein